MGLLNRIAQWFNGNDARLTDEYRKILWESIQAAGMDAPKPVQVSARASTSPTMTALSATKPAACYTHSDGVEYFQHEGEALNDFLARCLAIHHDTPVTSEAADEPRTLPKPAWFDVEEPQ